MDFLDVVELLVRIDTAIQHGRGTEALRLVLSNFSHLTDPAPLRERVAALLTARGERDRAIELYERVGLHYANAGHPARSLAVGLRLRDLNGGADALFERFTALYNTRSPFLDPEVRHASMDAPEQSLELDAQEPQLDADQLLEMAAERALHAGYIASDPGDLPPMTLLSRLPSEVLRPVLERLDVLDFSELTSVLESGETPRRLLWTVSQDLSIGRDDPTYRLPSGALLGVNAFGTAPIPNRSEVVARDGSRLLELSGEHVRALSDEFEAFDEALRSFRRDACVEALLEQHPLFDTVDEDRRVELLRTFSGVELEESTRLVPSDGESPGLFMLIDGEAELVRTDEDWEITVTTFHPGDVFGGIGLVSDKPDAMHVEMEAPGHFLFLPRDRFETIADEQAELAKYVVNLARNRLQEIEAALSANDLSEID